MRDQLIQYVQLLFAGAKDCEDIKQEILQNTLDRYDDLIAAGKVPEAAYQLAIAGIGDINEILGTSPQAVTTRVPVAAVTHEKDTPVKKLLRAIAVGLYIIAIIPLIILDGNILGFCGTLSIVAVATVLIMLGTQKDGKGTQNQEEKISHASLQKGISSILVKQKDRQTIFSMPSASDIPCRKRIKMWIWIIGIVFFLIVSLRTLAWGATWLMLPITAVAEQLVYALLDYKEVIEHET